jgi:hypothetical protein
VRYGLRRWILQRVTARIHALRPCGVDGETLVIDQFAPGELVDRSAISPHSKHRGAVFGAGLRPARYYAHPVLRQYEQGAKVTRAAARQANAIPAFCMALKT